MISMKPSERLILNTIAQYARTVINMILSLYTVRVVLSTLGQDDYGIYTLIAGVVSMLAFITNSLVTSTQRFISYNQGKQDLERIKTIFSNSLIIHIVIGLGLVVILESCAPLLFNGFLNIASERESAAIFVFQIVVVILFTTFITAPFKSLLISRENIVYISIIEVLDGIIKVGFVFMLTRVTFDKLEFYSLSMLAVQLFAFSALAVYCLKKYEECIIPSYKRMNKEDVKEFLSFTGWTVYGTACSVGQRQGIAIVLNRIMGTAVNAAYGIGYQLAGYASFLSSSIVNAIRPQIIKAEGEGNRERALRLSNITSKIVFLLMSMVFIPCMYEIDTILKLWLGRVPEYAGLFCIMAMATILADSISIGLTHINNAIGNIKVYSLVMCTPKLLALPIAWWMLRYGLPLVWVATECILIELIMAFVRIQFIQKQAGLDIKDFLLNTVCRESFCTILLLLLCYGIKGFFPSESWRTLLTIGTTVLFFPALVYCIGLCEEERIVLLNILKSIRNKIKF